MIVFVIHESYTAKIPHLYSGCQVFGDVFLLKSFKRLFELLFKCDDSFACVFNESVLANWCFDKNAFYRFNCY